MRERREAGRRCSWLEELDEPFLHEVHCFGRAAVAAVLDERDRAVAMLHRAFADRLPSGCSCTRTRTARFGWGPAFALLALGPAFGVFSMARLKQLRTRLAVAA